MRILVMSEHPEYSRNTEGMMQRVAEIDKFLRRESLSSSVDYLKLVIKDKKMAWISNTGKGEYFVLNIFSDFREIASLIGKYDAIYIHSLYNYVRISAFIAKSKHKVIIDLHGIVPEEEAFYGRPIRAFCLNLMERVMIRRSSLCIAVTKNMIRHFEEKYSFGGKYFHLPIFDAEVFNLKSAYNQEKRDIIIYAGGLQPWQNSHMIGNISKSISESKFIVECYIPDYQKDERESAILEDMKSLGIYRHGLSKNELYNVYRYASVGVILRDDIDINQVSSPTKLNEYLAFGMVPIIIQPNIGDFKFEGYQGIYYADVLAHGMPSAETIAEMASKNSKIYLSQKESIAGKLNVLEGILKEDVWE